MQRFLFLKACDEGFIDDSQGFWVEDEDEGVEGFLELDEDCFWVYDDESAAWFQRRFQGRRMKRGPFKGRKKGKGKGKGRGGRRFFKKKKGKSHMVEEDAWQTEWQSEWQETPWDSWSWEEATTDESAAKGKGKKGKKGKGKGKWNKGDKGDGKDNAAHTAEASQTTNTVAASTLYVQNVMPDEPSHYESPFESFMATPKEESSFLTHALTPTSMVLDLGCTRAMTSRRAAKDLMNFCDESPNCGIWYRLEQTTSQFTFANSESASCQQKIVICMYDRESAVQSTEFDIVEQGEVPTLMSLPQMRNLRFQLSLHPDKAFLSSPVLGIKSFQLKVARSSHLILDLLDVANYMWNVRFEKHKKVSFFTETVHYEFGYNQGETGKLPKREGTQEALAVEDEWFLDEAKQELIRIHKKERHQVFIPSLSPIPLEYLDSKRATIFEFVDGTKETKVDDWKDAQKRQEVKPKAWKGKTVFRILQEASKIGLL